jgi:septal ring factor EnvC (AmiA/AmiB activator)
MESVNEIKEALSARSRTATLDELRSEGRKRVRLIRAEHVAAMIAEAVHAAIDQSGLIAPEEAEQLVEKSRQEFRSILREREQEAQRAHEVEVSLAERDAQLAERERELAELKHRFEETAKALAHLRAELESVQGEYVALQQQHADMMSAPVAAAAPAAAAVPNDLLLSLVQEMATLKANLMTQQAHERAPAQSGGGAEFSAAIEKLTGSLNDRLEKLGKKMGVSAAVDSDAPMDFGGLFKDTGKALESNMDNIEVKQKAGGGIAANLARLKKLKGGG